MIKAIGPSRAPLLAAGAAVIVSLPAGALILPPDRCVASVILAGMMAAISVHDLFSFRVPNSLNLMTAGSGVLVALLVPDGGQDALSAVVSALVSAVVCGGVLLAVREAFHRLHGEDGLGLGDVKLGAAAGIWLGWELFVKSLLLASVACLLFVAACYLVDQRWTRARRIPFAVALAPAIWVTWYVNQIIIAHST